MLSESARVTTAAEARFRIAYPNSQPRSIKIIALDEPSAGVIKHIAGLPWNRATFLTASSFAGMPANRETWSMAKWLNDLAGRTKDLIAEVETADLVVMVATAGEEGHAASVIGEICHAKGVTTTALLLDRTGVTEEVLSKTLTHLRPYALMIVLASGEEYIQDMLIALRA